jgi:hypothetical protein
MAAESAPRKCLSYSDLATIRHFETSQHQSGPSGECHGEISFMVHDRLHVRAHRRTLAARFPWKLIGSQTMVRITASLSSASAWEPQWALTG